ncbi:hypothetical protein GCM10010341_55960 [Streptomyces noursei]|nr:hypothetical protein GCM10010341_55960 [Streptomyces noursei]
MGHPAKWDWDARKGGEVDAELAAPAPRTGMWQRKVNGAAPVEQRKTEGGTADEWASDPQATAP